MCSSIGIAEPARLIATCKPHAPLTAPLAQARIGIRHVEEDRPKAEIPERPH